MLQAHACSLTVRIQLLSSDMASVVGWCGSWSMQGGLAPRVRMSTQLQSNPILWKRDHGDQVLIVTRAVALPSLVVVAADGS